MVRYDAEKHDNYQYLAEVWLARFGTRLTKGSVDFKFLDPTGAVFDEKLLDYWAITRPKLNTIIEDCVDDWAMVEGIRGTLYEVGQLNYALDVIEERFFYEMVEEEEKLERMSA